MKSRKLKIGINGLGRIGRGFLRAWHKNPTCEIALINDLADAETLAYLIQYDSIHGHFAGKAQANDGHLLIDGIKISVVKEDSPAKIRWSDYGVDVVIEATGHFTDAHAARAHIEKGGAKKVIISAPAKNPDLTIALGINESAYNVDKHHVISNASCTTHCLAQVAHVLDKQFGIRFGMMTTIHSYTNDQKILDLPHKDLRRARAAGLSMIPTTTGAAKALGEVLPQLKGKLDGYALRVPTPNVSLVDFTVALEKTASRETINQAFIDVSQSQESQKYLAVCHDPLVSVDFMGDTHSAIIDLQATQTAGELTKVLAWYDNEVGYATRLYELATYIL